jgi:phosphotriesterase-related protein
MRNIIVFQTFWLVILLSGCNGKETAVIMTVNGPVPAREIGMTLTHEHILVDFIGADSINMNRWNDTKVAEAVLPFLEQARNLGCKTFIECTPAFLGRDPVLLKKLAVSSGLNIITNTGIYGAGNNKYIPAFVYNETSDQLAARWIDEWENGIENTGVRPGFIKIGVGGESLSDLHKKIVVAAARTHLMTGLTIASHTGPSVPAFEQIGILKEEGVSPEAFIWVHAQNDTNYTTHVKAAKTGSWVSFDGLDDNNVADYVKMIKNMKDNYLLGKVLLSHDAGWYHPGEPYGGNIRGYSALFEKLVPQLLKEGFTKRDILQLLVKNPADAFTVRVRTIKRENYQLS